MNRTPQAILFDLDGTLIDTTELILQCFQHSWTKVCGFAHSREVLIRTFGTPLRAAMNQLLLSATSRESSHDDAETNEKVVDRLLAEYRSFNLANHDRLARPFEGMLDVLAELRRRNYLISVVTSKSRELGLRGLGHCSLTGLVHSSVFLEDTSLHKPHPEPILTALKRLGAQAQTTAYVGDSPHDIVAARAAGVRAVAALWGPSPRTDLERERPDRLAGSISELLDIFN